MDNGHQLPSASNAVLLKEPSLDAEDDIENVAHRLAVYNQDADSGIVSSYLFPSATEIRLIHLDENSPATQDGEPIAPFYFGPDRAGGIIYPSAIALIRPEEKERLSLPEGWGAWDDAKPILREAN
jgi:hypothetical protein